MSDKMGYKEITNIVERMEVLEDRAGIRIQGIMATVETEANDDGEFCVTLMAEMVASGNIPLGHHVAIDFNAYNAKGQVCGTSFAFILNDQFIGIGTLNETIHCKSYPTKIKIIPKTQAC
jgi:hypothetical protein